MLERVVKENELKPASFRLRVVLVHERDCALPQSLHRGHKLINLWTWAVRLTSLWILLSIAKEAHCYHLFFHGRGGESVAHLVSNNGLHGLVNPILILVRDKFV